MGQNPTGGPCMTLCIETFTAMTALLAGYEDFKLDTIFAAHRSFLQFILNYMQLFFRGKIAYN
jgi:hypothetical protein